MKKLIFAALIMLFASCSNEMEFNYFMSITETVEPFCQSTVNFEKQVKRRFEIKDISEGESLIFQKNNTFEHIIKIKIDSVETKAIFRSECKVQKVRK